MSSCDLTAIWTHATVALRSIASDREAWLWVCGSDAVRYPTDDGDIELFGDDFDATVTSLSEQMSLYHPPVLWMHDGQSDALGYVRELRVLNRDDASARGVDISTDRALFARVELSDSAWAKYQGGAYAYTSPRIAYGYVDSTGRQWHSFMLELSFVTMPHQEVSQPRVWDTREIIMAASAARTQEVQMEDEENAVEGPEGGDEIAQIAQEQAAQRERISRIEEMLKGIVERMDAEPDVEMSSDSEPDVEMSARVQKLEAALAASEAAREVDSFCSGRVLSDTQRDALVELRVRDKRAYELATQFAGTPAPRKTERAAKAGQPVDLSDKSELHKTVRATMAAKGVGYTEALRLVTMEVK